MNNSELTTTDRVASVMLKGGLASILLLLCAFQLATWVPHLLTWPLFVDHDVFATMARGWDHGVLPYREGRGNNFPGSIYLFWIIGKVFGWGKTWPAFALDASFVILFGAAMIRWTWRRTRRILPGAVGFSAFLSYYLASDYTLVFQRDWHGPLFMMLALMTVDSRRGRASLVISSLCAAIAFTIRPQVVLLIPAVLFCWSRDDEGERRGFGSLIGASTAWMGLFGIFTGLLFLPIILQGLWPDFLAGVRLTTYGTSYNQATWPRILKTAALQAMHLNYVIIPAGILLLLPQANPKIRSSAWACLIALAGAWCYRPASPVPWPYLSHPYNIVLAVATAMLVQMILETDRGSAPIRLVLVLFVLIGAGVTIRPKYSSVQASSRALADLRRGGLAERLPLGVGDEPGPDEEKPYTWDEYRAVVRYLHDQTPPGTKVANLLVTSPALAAPADRTSALPAESLAWLVVAPKEETNFLKAIEQGDEQSVVVWSPQEENLGNSPRLAYAVRDLAPAIRRHYQPRVKFGRIEVWERKPGDHPL